MFFGKKEKHTEKLIKEHIDVVGEVVKGMQQCIDDYCDEKKKFKRGAGEVRDGETQADQIRREIEISLHEGAFMPIQRGDYARLVESVDKVANQCEATAEFLILTRPELTEEVVADLHLIMEATVRCYSFVPQMYDEFDKGRVVMDLAHNVEAEEKKVDQLFDHSVRKLFKSDLDLAHKLHVKLLLDRTAAITNRIEDASDMFQVIVAARP